MSEARWMQSQGPFWETLELTPLQRALLEEHLVPVQLKPGEPFWREGEISTTCMAFLVQGRMKALKNNEFGTGRIVLGILEPGRVVGLPFADRSVPMGSTLEAMDEVELLSMCDGLFTHILEEHLPLGIHLLRHIHRDFQQKMQHVADRLVSTF